MLELIAGVAVAVAVLALVLEPLIRPSHAAASLAAENADDELTPLEESDSPKVRALLALKEIEFDRATGKLSDEDYERLKARYARQAIDAMDAEEVPASPVAAAAVAEDPAEALIRSVRSGLRVCPSCGPRPETEAAFCSTCGRPLTGPGR
jgi:hypothetical protein